MGKDLPFAGSLPGAGQVEPRCLELNPRLLHGSQSPKALYHPFLILTVHSSSSSSKLDWKQRVDLTPGTLTQGAGVPSGLFTTSIIHFLLQVVLIAVEVSSGNLQTNWNMLGRILKYM